MEKSSRGGDGKIGWTLAKSSEIVQRVRVGNRIVRIGTSSVLVVTIKYNRYTSFVRLLKGTVIFIFDFRNSDRYSG